MPRASKHSGLANDMASKAGSRGWRGRRNSTLSMLWVKFRKCLRVALEDEVTYRHC